MGRCEKEVGGGEGVEGRGEGSEKEGGGTGERGSGGSGGEDVVNKAKHN